MEHKTDPENRPVDTERSIQELEARLTETKRKEAELEQLLAAEQARRDQAEALLGASAALVSTLNYEEVLDRTLEQVGQLIPHDAISILLVEEEKARVFRRRGYTRFAPRGRSIAPSFNIADTPVLHAMQESNEAVVISDVETDERWVSDPMHAWVKSYAGIPIWVRGRTIGFLNLHSATPDFFAEIDLRRLQRLAEQIGIALENARLHDQTRQEVVKRVRALKQERNFISTVLDTANALVMVLNKQGRIVRFNRACVQITGYTFDEVKGKYWGELFLPPRDQDSIKADFDRLQVGQDSAEYESYWVTKSGEWRLIAWAMTAFDMGPMAYILVTGIDLTERKRAEEALQSSEERFRQVVSSISDHVYVTRIAEDGSPVNLYLSPHIEPLTGYSREQFLNDWHFWPEKVIHPDDQADASRQAAQLTRGISSEMEYRLIRADGNVIWVRDSARIESEGPVKIIYGVVSDVTERKQAEEALKTTNRQLKTLTDRLQRELTVAQRIQQSLLSTARPTRLDLDLVCYSSPAWEVGGDFYAYYTLSSEEQDDHLLVAVGDVSGKGMPAALLMAVSLTALQSAIDQAVTPGEILVQLDRIVEPYTKTTRQYCALCCAVLNGPTLRVANAGCIMPIIRRANGQVEWVNVGGLPLGTGLGTHQGYTEAIIAVAPGDLVVLTSDGVVEATDDANNLFGFERLEKVVAAGPQTSAAAMLAHLQAEVAGYTGNTEPHDDRTIVVLQV